MHLKWKITTIKGRKHCEKRRNCLLQAISPFLAVLFTAFISLVCQNEALCGNALSTKLNPHTNLQQRSLKLFVNAVNVFFRRAWHYCFWIISTTVHTAHWNGEVFFFHYCLINPLPNMPILGSSSSAANNDMMAKIYTNGDTIICMSRKHSGKRRNCSLRAISSFSTLFSKVVSCWCLKMSICGVKG